MVPAPDPLRLAVPKAYVVLAEGWEPAAGDRQGRSSRTPARVLAPVQAGPAAGVRRAAQDHLGQDPPGRAARAPRAGRQRRRVPRGGLPVTELSYAPARARTPLLGDTIGANLDRAVAALRRPRGARRRADRAALDLRRVRRRRRPGGAAALLGHGRRARATGSASGRQLRRVGARAVRHRQDRRDPGQHQPGVPRARAGVRAQPVRDARCWSSAVAYKTSDYRAMVERGARPSARRCARSSTSATATWDELLGRGGAVDRGRPAPPRGRR